MLGAGAVEHFYCRLSPKIFYAYTTHYGMSEEQAETYRLHGTMDHEHAERAFAVLDDAIVLHGWETVRLKRSGRVCSHQSSLRRYAASCHGRPGLLERKELT
jgi:hypothetical protein